MGDRYASFAHSGPGRALIRRFGLPEPPKLHRYRPGDPLLPGPVLLGTAAGGRVAGPAANALAGAEVELLRWPDPRPAGELPVPPRPRLHAALGFDATGIGDSTGLTALPDFFRPYLRSLYPNGRVLVFGLPPAAAGSVAAATAQQALVGFVRSLGKEVGRGITTQLVQVGPGAEENLESTLRFLLSTRSAYVSGQVIRVAPAPVTVPGDWQRPLHGRVALVTGAAGGLGAACVEVLARDGAQVVCADSAGAGDALAAVANQAGGTATQLDLTGPAAPQRLAEHLAGRHGRVDIVVHSAGITRDRPLSKLSDQDWQAVLELNLTAVERLQQALSDAELLPDGGRVIAISSLNGIAGSRWQSNDAAAKAGLIGMVEALAPRLADRGITVNAVAPGFIHTGRTERMPRVQREFGRRMNSLAQGGEPVDVAETVSWLASPGSGGVSGQVVRVCGQSLLGA